MSDRERSPAPRRSVCRTCGAVGLEAADDVAPGLCPPCLDRAMARATSQLALEDALFGREHARRRAPALLRSAGLTPAAVDAFLAAAADEGPWPPASGPRP